MPLDTLFSVFDNRREEHEQVQYHLFLWVWNYCRLNVLKRFCKIWAEKWIRYTIFKKYVHDWLLPTCFQVKHESLNCKGQKKCLQNRHKRKHCWALDATVKIADARSLRSEGQMLFFLWKSGFRFPAAKSSSLHSQSTPCEQKFWRILQPSASLTNSDQKSWK